MTDAGDATRDVVVVGGGVSGLACAVAAARAGLRPLVLERSSLLGGRARSWTDEKTGDPVHIGPHIMLSQYQNFFALLEMVGGMDKVVWQPMPDFITMVEGTTEVTMGLADLPPPMPFLPSVLADKSVGLVDKLSNFRLTAWAMTITEEEVLRLDDKDARTLLREMGVTERYIDRFWSFVSMAIMNVPLDRCSAAALMRFYRRLVGHRRCQVAFADGGLGDLFAPGARDVIEAAGGEVRTRTAVAGFALDEAGGVDGVVLEGGEVLRARAVVAALTPQELATLAHPSWEARRPFSDLARFEPCPYVSTYLWFDEKLTKRQFWARVHREDDLNCDFYDLSNIHRGWESRPSVICTNAIWSHRAAHLSDAEVVERTRAELAEYLPRAAKAKLVHSVVNRIPMAIHCPQPGTEALRPDIATGIRGLYLAGDWTKTGFPSSMEGAARSGFLAAERVLEVHGRRERVAIDHDDVEGFTRLFGRVAAWRRGLSRELATT